MYSLIITVKSLRMEILPWQINNTLQIANSLLSVKKADYVIPSLIWPPPWVNSPITPLELGGIAHG